MLSDEERELRRRRARERVALPAHGLMILAGFGVVLGVVLVVFGGGFVGGADPDRQTWFLVIGAVLLVWCPLMWHGAAQMEDLGNYRASKRAAWMGVIPLPVPFYPFWFIAAVFALVVLSDPGVRAAFASGRGRPRRDDPPPSPPEPPDPLRPVQVGAGWADDPEPRAVAVGVGWTDDPEPRAVAVPVAPPDAQAAWEALDATSTQLSKRAKERARNAVYTASTLLLITWAFLAVVSAVMFAMTVTMVGLIFFVDAQPRNSEMWLQLVVLVGTTTASVVTVVFGLYGAWKLKQERSLGWGKASAVLLLVSHCTCLIALGIGIWVLMLLNPPEVRKLFDSHARYRRT